MNNDASVAAIAFALIADEGMAFLRSWNEGNFEACRKEWPEAPEAVYIGADPLLETHVHVSTNSPMVNIAARNIRSFLNIAVFDNPVDKWSAGQCVDVLLNHINSQQEQITALSRPQYSYEVVGTAEVLPGSQGSVTMVAFPRGVLAVGELVYIRT